MYKKSEVEAYLKRAERLGVNEEDKRKGGTPRATAGSDSGDENDYVDNDDDEWKRADKRDDEKTAVNVVVSMVGDIVIRVEASSQVISRES